MAVGNLSFAFNPETDTPETIAKRRALADALMGRTLGRAPSNVGEGLQALGNAIAVRRMMGSANKAEKSGRAGAAEAFRGLFGGDEIFPDAPGGDGADRGSFAEPIDSATARVDAAHNAANADVIRTGLIDRGMPEHVADAFIMNFEDESALNPGINEADPIVPGSRGGFGLAQWTGPRRKALEAFAAERGKPVGDVDTQLDFLMTELQGPEAAAAEAILGAQDTPTAAAAILNKFLRPAESHRAARERRYLAAGPGVTVGPEDTDRLRTTAQRMQVGAPQRVASADPASAVAAALAGGGRQPGATIAPQDIEMLRATAPTDGMPYSGPGQTIAPQDVERLRPPENPYASAGVTDDIFQRMQTGAPAGPPLPMPPGMQQGGSAAGMGGGIPGTPIPDPRGPMAAPGMVPQAAPQQRVAQALTNNFDPNNPAETPVMFGGTADEVQPGAQGGQPSMQELIGVMTHPWASDAQRSVAQAMLQQHMQAQDPKRQLEIQKLQQELATSGQWEGPAAFQTLALRARDAGLEPGTPEYQQFMATGGRSPDESAANQRIDRMTENLMATGDFVDPQEAKNIAVGIVDGRLKTDRHPVTGELQIIDMATGRPVYGGRQQPSAPTLEAPETPMSKEDRFGRQFPASNEAFGVPGAIAGGINQLSDVIGAGPVYPEIQQTQADFGVLRESLLNDIAGAYNRQPPSWLLKEIRELTPAAGSPFQGASGAQSKMNAIGRNLESELNATEQALQRELSPKNRQKLEARRDGLQMGLQRVTSALQSFQNQPSQDSAPAVGTVEEGYRFKGGDPADERNWERVQ